MSKNKQSRLTKAQMQALRALAKRLDAHVKAIIKGREHEQKGVDTRRPSAG